MIEFDSYIKKNDSLKGIFLYEDLLSKKKK